MFLGCNFLSEETGNQEIEYEINKEKAYKMIEQGLPFSNEIGLVTSPCIAIKRKITLKPNEEKTLNLIISVSEKEENVIQNLEIYRLMENIRKEFNIARAKAQEEARYLSLDKKDLMTYQAVLPYILYQNPMKSTYMKELAYKEYKQSDFWKYGISGDNPIILVMIKSVNDIYVIKEILKVHEYLRIKGIQTDLIILDYEKNIYEQYVKEQIIQEILNMQIGYQQNISGGIYLLNNNEIQDEDLFKLKANIIIKANRGNVLDSIKEMEEEYKKSLKNIGYDKDKIINIPEFEKIKPNIELEKLQYFNGFGGFSEDRKRIYN